MVVWKSSIVSAYSQRKIYKIEPENKSNRFTLNSRRVKFNGAKSLYRELSNNEFHYAAPFFL